MKAKFHPFAVVAALAELLSLFLLHQIPNCCENIKGRMGQGQQSCLWPQYYKGSYIVSCRLPLDCVFYMLICLSS